MTIKHLSIIVIFLFTIVSVSAQERNVDDALNIARRFTSAQSIKSSSLIKSAHSARLTLVHTAKDNTTNNPQYYAFNRSSDRGYIIVSADTRTEEVLAYSDSGEFDVENMPENMREWLNFYSAEIEALQNGNIVPNSESSDPAMSSVQTPTCVEPLLGNIKWNQGEPYNNKCPMHNGQRTVTGCIATAMAQIMKYHKWPSKGQGSISYTTRSLGISVNVNFANSYYQWDQMTDTYNAFSMSMARNAVALLMRDCGASVLMNYTPYASSGFDFDVPNGFIKYFNYDSDVRLVSKSEYTYAQWMNLFKLELNASRPIYHSGSSVGGGHAVVCDGYDEDDFFHFNWGWGGYQNGYFRLSALNPETGGIGAGSEDGYNMGITAVIGIQKPDGESHENQQLILGSAPFTKVDSVGRGEKFYVFTNGIYNISSITFQGSIGIAGFQNTDTALIQTSILQGWAVQDIAPTLGFGPNFYFEYRMPAEVPNGTYRIYTMCSMNGENKHYKLMYYRANIPNYILARVTDDFIYFSQPTGYEPRLSLQHLSIDNTPHSNSLNDVSFRIKNNGIEYCSEINVVISNGEETQKLRFPSQTILSGDSLTVSSKQNITVSPGEYYVYVTYDNANKESTPNTVLGDSIKVLIHPEPYEMDSIVLTKKIAVHNDSNVNSALASLEFEVCNIGGFATNHLYAYVYKSDGEKVVAKFPYTALYMDKGDTLSHVVSAPLNLPRGTYRVEVFTYHNDGIDLLDSTLNHTFFTITDSVEPVTHQLSFDAGIGSVGALNKLVYEQCAIGELPTPIRDGFVFIGWEIDSAFISPQTIWTDSVSRTAVASWDRLLVNDSTEYLLLLDGDGGVVENTTKTVFTDSVIGQLPVPVREKHIFIEWRINGTPIDSATIWAYDSHQVATAMWEKDRTDVESIEENITSIAIYPNPARDFIIVDGAEVNSTVNIYSVVGKLIASEQLSQDNSISIKNLQRGTYIVQIVAPEGGQSSQKIVKM